MAVTPLVRCMSRSELQSINLIKPPRLFGRSVHVFMRCEALSYLHRQDSEDTYV